MRLGAGKLEHIRERQMNCQNLQLLSGLSVIRATQQPILFTIESVRNVGVAIKVALFIRLLAG
jgi:hypothetical protein